MKISDYLSRSIVWNDTDDVHFPYAAESEGVGARIRLNDFPAEQLYTLLVGDAEFDFDNWPSSWVRKTN